MNQADDILRLLQLVVLVELHFANKHHSQHVGLFVNLGLLLNLFNNFKFKYY